jgi:DNA replication protein DnaC
MTRQQIGQCADHGGYQSTDIFVAGHWVPGGCPSCHREEFARQSLAESQAIESRRKTASLRKIGIPERYLQVGLQNTGLAAKGMDRARILSWLNRRATYDHLVLVGEPNTGKTLALSAIAKLSLELDDRPGHPHAPPIFINFGQLRQMWSYKLSGELFPAYTGARLLCIDDFSERADHASDYSSEFIKAVTKVRHDHNLPTMVSCRGINTAKQYQSQLAHGSCEYVVL